MEIIAVVSLMSAFAQPTRLRCYMTLLDKGPMTSGDLAATLGVPANTMSSHLTVLGTAKLVSSTRSGRNITYNAETARLDELRSFLSSITH